MELAFYFQIQIYIFLEHWMETKNELNRLVNLKMGIIHHDYFSVFRRGYDEKTGWLYYEFLNTHADITSKIQQDIIFEAAEYLAKKYNAELQIGE
jgi:hypothetical protein